MRGGGGAAGGGRHRVGYAPVARRSHDGGAGSSYGGHLPGSFAAGPAGGLHRGIRAAGEARGIIRSPQGARRDGYRAGRGVRVRLRRVVHDDVAPGLEHRRASVGLLGNGAGDRCGVVPGDVCGAQG